MNTWSKESVLRFNLLELSDLFEESLELCLKPYPKGYYKELDEHPTFTPNEAYFCYGSGNMNIELNRIKYPVYNESGVLVFDPRPYLNSGINIDSIFKDKPSLPYRGFNIIKAIITDLVLGLQKEREYTKRTESEILLDFLRPDLNIEFDDSVLNCFDQLKNYLLEIKQAVIDFIDQDYYNEYHIESDKNVLIITKGADFRIKEYYRLKEIIDNISL